uniref:Reverse transcriptase domain-containing protein n=1 Tax=Tanacetum cinerariifolium TaxID=118510 RepID=A0A699GK86_TANCI|nr:reverse transcriptase domain-containing protein [Tanacetum cinerariifolium]
MQIRSSSRLVSNPSSNPTPSTNPNPKGRNHRRSKQKIEEFNLDELSPPIVTMANQRTMAQLLQAPTVGYEDEIVVPTITTDNFELKHGLLTLVQNKQFFGHDKEDPHAHIRYFNKITSTLKFSNVPNTSIKIMLFPFSLEGAAQIWLEKEPPRSIFTWDDLVSKFINQFFPPSKTTNLRNEITNFQQRFDESCSEAWDRFKDLLRACPHHDKMPRECLAIIESKSKVRYSRNKPVVAKVSTNTSTSGILLDVAELKDMVKALLLDKKSQNQAPAPVKAVEESCFVNSNSASSSSSGTLPSNIIANPRSDLKAITTQSDVSYDGPQFPSSTSFLPKVVQSEFPILNSKPVTSPFYEPVIAPVSTPKPNTKSSIPYPSRRNDERNREKANNQIEKFYQIFKDMSFEISFADALILMPKFTSTLKALIGNKEKLSEMARTPLNEHCSAVLLKKLPKKLGDPGKFLIPCDFPEMAECLALADLSANINLMPWSVWKRLSLPNLTPTCMTLELADRLISRPVRVGEDVYVKVGSFHFSADFVVVDLDADPRVPLSLGRSFLKTGRALIDVFEANYSDMTVKRIDVIDMACEEYSEKVLGFFDVIASGNPTPCYDPIVSTTSSTLTSFRNSDFLLEEVDAFLAIEDDPTSPELDQSCLDPEGDILLLEAFLNDDLSLPLPTQGNYLPEVRKELKIYEAKSDKSSIDEPAEVELKDLPPHLEYALLEGDDKFGPTSEKSKSQAKNLLPILIWGTRILALFQKQSLTKLQSSAKNLLPILSEYEVTSDDDSECDVPVKDDSSPAFTTFSNPLFDDNDDFTSSDDESLPDEDVPIEEFKFDYLEEFSGALMPTSIADEERIRREYAEYISLMKKLFTINLFPRPLENFHANTILETLPTSSILIEDSDSQREEINIFTGTDELLPPDFKSDDYDSEGDIHFLEELLVDDSIPFLENELSNFDYHDDSLFPRPLPEPPDDEFFEPEVISAVKNNNDELNEDECFDPRGEINIFANVEDDDYFPFIFVIRIFLPYLIYPEVSPLLLSTGSEDTIFIPGISI